MRHLLTLTMLLCFVTAASAEELRYTGMFWNIHSGNSQAATIGANMAQKGPVDFWGLSEVPPGPTFLASLERQIEAATGINYTSKMSRAGRGDRLAILYNADRLTSEPYSGGRGGLVDLGDDFFEVTSINTSRTVRPSLGIQLKAEDGQSVVVLVNHWKAEGDSRSRGIRTDQAEATNTFANRTPDLPIIVGGDHNIPIRRGRSRQQQAFRTLTRVFDYLEPNNSSRSVASFRSGSVLDSVFVAHELPDWESETTILARVGKQPAVSRSFNDNRRTSDHRPVRLVLTSDSDSRIEALEEQLRAAEDLVARLKARIERLRDGS